MHNAELFASFPYRLSSSPRRNPAKRFPAEATSNNTGGISRLRDMKHCVMRQGAMHLQNWILFLTLQSGFGQHWACFRSSFRLISISQLNTLLHLHLWPINDIVYVEPQWRSYLRGSFTLRCLQRLSRPYVATQPCPWQNNWYTRGMSIPVLSY